MARAATALTTMAAAAVAVTTTREAAARGRTGAIMTVAAPRAPKVSANATEPRDQPTHRRADATAMAIARESSLRSSASVATTTATATTMAAAAAAVTTTRNTAARRRTGAMVTSTTGLGTRAVRQRTMTKVAGVCPPPSHNVANTTVLGSNTGAATRDQLWFD